MSRFCRRSSETKRSRWLPPSYSSTSRAADPSGQAFWLQQLANGKSRADVALAMLSGPEAKQVLVKGFYVRFLKRQADSNGLAMFQNQLLHGVREEAVIVEIVASTEYYARP